MRSKRHISHTKVRPPDKKISVVIPAAGAGYRMKSYGPKCMLELKTETVIQRQIKQVHKRFTNYEIVIVGGFRSDKLFQYLPNNFIKVQNERFEETNVVRSIEIGINASTSENILIMYGDLVFEEGILNSLDTSETTMLVGANSQHHDTRSVGCVIVKNNVESACWKIPNKWSQILYIHENRLAQFKTCLGNEKWFGFESINEMINKFGPIKAQVHKQLCLDIDSAKDLDKIKEIVC